MVSDQDQDAKPLYSQTQLKQLISSAERLGFWDDVIHFQNELAKLQQPIL